MGRVALITGITGQDGSYLSELLLEKGYTVYGLVRRSAAGPANRVGHLTLDPDPDSATLEVVPGDLTDTGSLVRALTQVQPDEVYNLGAQSHVRVSFDAPDHTAEATGLGTLRLLEAIRMTGQRPRFFQASSSELFGKAQEVPQRETTPFYPRSPYGCAKAFAHYLTVNYRESYGLHASCGIMFNHESPRRGEAFVTRKITRAAARIKLGLQGELRLGNLDAARDWGYAGDYVRAMWLMLQRDEPGDYVIATGEAHTVRDFLTAAFGELDLDWEDYVTLDPSLHRPAEVDRLVGDASKARAELGWTPSIDFLGLVKRMVASDLELARRELAAGGNE
ncbi:MAG: GDP-mannose 4,6-dehydratase [Planctomycetes bacterium]|nr:GDP-mannose 4,6-dehydratase [Planctomycetota bacterium]